MAEKPRRRDRDTLDQTKLNNAYAAWAPIYDLVFGAVFDHGRKASIEAAERIGGRILDVGIGTGISLLDFSPSNSVIGVDISEPMLRRAHRRVIDEKLAHVEGLAVMDAEKLEFPDNSFDVVMAQYVVTAVPNPEKALDEFARVPRLGGELIILTRLSAYTCMRSFIEQKLQPVVRPLGFRTAEFAWSRYAQWLAGARGIELAERRLVPPLGHFSLVRFRKVDVAAAA